MNSTNSTLGVNFLSNGNADDSFATDDNVLGLGAASAQGEFGLSFPTFTFPAATQPAVTPPLAATSDDVVINSGAGHVTFDLKFVSADNPTANFMTDVENAARILSADIKENITLNITVGYGEINGTSLTSGEAEGGPDSGVYASYSTVHDDLLANKSLGDLNFSALPIGSSIGGQSQITVWNAEAKALGLMSATATGDDGMVGFAAGIADSQMVGVALHELTHAMGRMADGPQPDIFDLFRFTGVGTYDFSSSGTTNPNAYFSVDGGVTAIAVYGQNSDPGDWANKSYGTPTSSLTPDDAFDQYYSSSTNQNLSRDDLLQLDVLGFNTYSALTAPCFVRGVRIRTQRGAVAVEDLRIGDQVDTVSGGSRPIVWIGHRKVAIAGHPEPEAVRPVRVAANAFGEGLPSRDLWLSPGHNVAFEGALMPISALVNGRSVQQIEQDRVEYWHVELDAHDVLFAEGLPAESYLDCGNRTAFANGGAFVEAHPDFRPRHWAETCLPLVKEGPQIARVRSRLLANLALSGISVTQDGDAHIVADGLRVDPIRLSPTRLAFALPADAEAIELRSKVFIPAQTSLDNVDSRELGLCVGRLQVDGEDVALDSDAAGADAWHEAEIEDGRFQRRWTRGAAPLPARARIVIVDLVGEGYYWREAERAAVAIPSPWPGAVARAVA